MCAPDPSIIRKAVINGLEKHFYNYEGSRYGIFAQSGRPALTHVEDAHELFGRITCLSDIRATVSEIRSMSAALAVLYLGDKILLDNGGPKEQVLLGLLYGFPPCCIRYFIERNYYDKKHPHEFNDGYQFYLRCEPCSTAGTWTSWCQDHEKSPV